MREALTITCSTVLVELSCARAGTAAAIARIDDAAKSDVLVIRRSPFRAACHRGLRGLTYVVTCFLTGQLALWLCEIAHPLWRLYLLSTASCPAIYFAVVVMIFGTVRLFRDRSRRAPIA